MPRPAIAAIGGLCQDVKYFTLGPAKLETSNRVRSCTSLGGVAHNVAKSLGRLGCATQLVSVVGDDLIGQQLLKGLAAVDIATNYCVMAKNQPTAQYHAILDDQGELVIALADMALFEQPQPGLVGNAIKACADVESIFLDTNLDSELILEVISFARRQHKRLFIDPVSVAKSLKLPQSLEGVFCLTPDRLEAEAMTGVSIDSVANCKRAATALLCRGVQQVIITLGEKGVFSASDNHALHLPAFKTAVVDISGAGDALMAGIIAALEQNQDIVTACRWGMACAAITLGSAETTSVQLSKKSLHAYLSTEVSLCLR